MNSYPICKMVPSTPNTSTSGRPAMEKIDNRTFSIAVYLIQTHCKLYSHSCHFHNPDFFHWKTKPGPGEFKMYIQNVMCFNEYGNCYTKSWILLKTSPLRSHRHVTVSYVIYTKKLKCSLQNGGHFVWTKYVTDHKGPHLQFTGQLMSEVLLCHKVRSYYNMTQYNMVLYTGLDMSKMEYEY